MRNNNNALIIKYVLMAFPLAFFGTSMYIYLPKFYYEHYSISLRSISLVLLLLRVFYSFFDLIIGIVSDKLLLMQKKYFIFFFSCLAVLYNMLFIFSSAQDKGFVFKWFIVCSVFIYLFVSLITVNYYKLGLYAGAITKSSFDVAALRELSLFAGSVFSALAPFFIMRLFDNKQQAFLCFGGILFCIILVSLFFFPKNLCSVNVISSYKEKEKITNNILIFLQKKEMYLLVFVLFLNYLPQSILLSMFEFYVDDCLNDRQSIYLFLTTYLCFAAISSMIAFLFIPYYGNKNILIFGIICSIVSLFISCFIVSTYSYFFYCSCVIAGIGFGCEIIAMPSFISSVMKKKRCYSSTFFGIVSSANKIILALSAFIFLPIASGESKLFFGLDIEDKIRLVYIIVPFCIKIVVLILFLFVSRRLILSKNS